MNDKPQEIQGMTLDEFKKQQEDEEKGLGNFVVSPPSFSEPPKTSDAYPFIAPAVGAVAGAASRTGEIRNLISRIVSAGVSPEAAIAMVGSELNDGSMRPSAQPSGSTAAQIMEPGKMSSGDKWAAKIGGPGGATAEQAYENYRTRKKLAEGETLLRSGLVLPPTSSPRGSASSISQLINAENAANRARMTAEIRSAYPFGYQTPRVKAAADWAARTPGIVGKGLGALGGAAAAYEGYDAYKAFQNAEDTPAYIDAILKSMTAAGSGMASTPIPGAQIPGLLMGVGIPAAGWMGQKISNALPSWGTSKEAEEAFRPSSPPRRQ